MAGNKDKMPDGVVTSSTELGLALHENMDRILIVGPLATAIYYGQLSLLTIEIGVIFLFVCLFMAIYNPVDMLPLALICSGVISVSFLPLIFLRYIHVPLTLLLKSKSNYRQVDFHASKSKLLLVYKKGRHARHAGKGKVLKRLRARQHKTTLEKFKKLEGESKRVTYESSIKEFSASDSNQTHLEAANVKSFYKRSLEHLNSEDLSSQDSNLNTQTRVDSTFIAGSDTAYKVYLEPKSGLELKSNPKSDLEFKSNLKSELEFTSNLEPKPKENPRGRFRINKNRI